MRGIHAFLFSLVKRIISIVKMPKTFPKLLSVLMLLFIGYQLFGNISSNEEIIKSLQNKFTIKNQVWGIETNPQNGFVYLATNTGLLEFDGLSFTPQEMQQNKILRSIFIDSSGIIYTGGFETFGFWVQDAQCKLNYIALSDSIEMTKNDEIWKIYEWNNTLYFQSFTSIYLYKQGTLSKITGPGFMLFMFQVNNQFIVQVLEQGLYIFTDSSFTFVENSEQFINKKIHSIIPYQHNNLLICTEKNGIFKYDTKDFTYWNSPISDFLIQNTCNAAQQLDDTSFVFGTILNGVVFTDKNGVLIDHYNFSHGLHNNTVLTLSKACSGGIWVGLDEGVNFLNQGSQISYYATGKGSLGTIYTLLMSNNTVYLGSNHGLFKSEIEQVGQNLNFSKLTLVPNSQGQVWTIAKFNDQILCGHNDGTFTVGEKGLSKISDVTGGWTIMPYGDFLLEGTYTGLVTFKQNNLGQWVFRNRLEGFYEPTKHLEIDYLGYIWASHPQKGIFRLKVNENKDSIVEVSSYTQPKNQTELTNVYKLNNRIVFSSASGFFTYDYVNDSMVPFNILNQSLGNYQQSSQIIHYEKNLYWFVDQNKLALFRISIESEPTLINEFSIADASMPGQDLAIIPLNNRGFLISNRNGLAVLKNTDDDRQLTAKGLFIKNAFFYGKTKSRNICSNEIFKAPYSQNNVSFKFSDPSAVYYSNPQYKYRITEIEESWLVTEYPEIRYYHLKPGTYHLEICSDKESNKLVQEFVISAPWYLTIWAFIGYFIALIGVILALFAYFKNKLNEQRKLLEFEVKQTTLENRLQNTNVELMLTLRYLIQKNESLQNLQAEINRVKENPVNIPTKFIKTLDKEINQGLELQTKEWKMALNNLKLSQEGYFKRLKENFPKLTNHDIRLCSYLRMNFTSKEIAHLLNISTRAVEISRYRLRKKLNLEHDINLTDFLMQDGL